MHPDQILKMFFQTIEKIRAVARTLPAEYALQILAELEALDWTIVMTSKKHTDQERIRLTNENRLLLQQNKDLKQEIRRLRESPETWARAHPLSRVGRNRARKRLMNPRRYMAPKPPENK